MCEKNNLPLWIISLIIMFSVVAALTPVSDVDSDGEIDSLITEGLLLFPLLYSIIERSAQRDRITSAQLSVPRALTRRFLHPPILA
jgi:hypothetical protein